MMSAWCVQAPWKKMKWHIFLRGHLVDLRHFWLTTIGLAPALPFPCKEGVFVDPTQTGGWEHPACHQIRGELQDAGSSANSFLSMLILFSDLENSRFFILHVKYGCHLSMCSKDLKDTSLSTEETVNSWGGVSRISTQPPASGPGPEQSWRALGPAAGWLFSQPWPGSDTSAPPRFTSLCSVQLCFLPIANMNTYGCLVYALSVRTPCHWPTSLPPGEVLPESS